MQCWRVWFFTALVSAMSLVSVPFVLTAQAAELEEVSFRLTRQQVSTETDVEVAFITPSGIDSPTDQIDLTFAPAFDISSLAFSDVTITYGPVSGTENTTTVAAAAGINTWGVQRSVNTMILIPPTNALPGTITAGYRIVVRLGTWAGGVHQVVTPVTNGIFPLSIAGGFGDAGAAYTEIRTPDSLDVVVTVDNGSPPPPSPTGGVGGPVGGGDPTGGPLATDGTAPTIMNLRAELITPTSAMIRWATNEVADAFLEYGRTAAAYTLGTRDRVTRLLEHEIPLSDLLPETEYHLHVRARDAANNTRWSADFSFRTEALPREPIISGVNVTYVDDHQAIVRWATNVDTIWALSLGSPVIRTYAEGAYAATHQLTLTGLMSDTTYTFGIFASRPTGESTRADGFSFRTLSDRTPPSNVLSFRATYIAASRVVELRWVNPAEPDFNTVVITRLNPDGTPDAVICSSREMMCVDPSPPARSSVVYQAVAYDLSGNPSSGAIAVVSIPTAPAVTPPPAVPPITLPEDGADGVVRPPAVPPTTPITPPVVPATPAVPGSLTSPAVPSVGSGSGPSSGLGTVRPDDRTEVGALPPILDPSGALEGGAGAGGSDGSDSATSSAPPSGTTSEGVLHIAPEFFLAELVPAVPDSSGFRSALFLHPIQVRVLATSLPISLAQAQIQTSGGSVYQLAYRDELGAYVADFSFDSAQGRDQFVQMQAVATDGRRWTERFPFRVFPAARVLDATDERRVAAVAGAAIELVADRVGGAVTRIEADASGRYALIVPNGRYRLRVAKEGFGAFERRLQVENGLVVEDVRLRRSLRPLSDIWNPQASLRENLASIGDEAALGVQIGLEVARSPEVQTATENVVAPVVVAATVGTTASAVTGFTLFSYLRFIFTQPFLLLRRRKRQAWGVVYNALSKQPIELAVVRLLKAGTSFALQTRITDAQGRFSFFVPAGAYVIQVQKPGFQFPTQYLKEARVDVDFTDLYHGEAIKVTGPITISPNIPLDPAAKEETPRAIVRRGYWRKAQSALGVGGIIVGLAAIVIDPSVKMVIFALFQVAIYVVFRRLAVPPAPKRWGIVYDTDQKRPLSKAVVRIFDKKFNKLLETQITSKDGTYGFFAAKGLYYLTAEKPGYERYLSADLDLTQATDTYIDHRFSLKRAGTAVK